jgi:hypothetical protein
MVTIVFSQVVLGRLFADGVQVPVREASLPAAASLAHPSRLCAVTATPAISSGMPISRHILIIFPQLLHDSGYKKLQCKPAQNQEPGPSLVGTEAYA